MKDALKMKSTVTYEKLNYEILIVFKAIQLHQASACALILTLDKYPNCLKHFLVFLCFNFLFILYQTDLERSKIPIVEYLLLSRG